MVSVEGRKYEYDVILSYILEDRGEAKILADALRDFDVSVYDEYEQEPTRGRDIFRYLSDLYQNKARHCVVLLSKHYIDSWRTGYELQVAQTRALHDTEYIFYLSLDETIAPGFPSNAVYFKVSDEDIKGIKDIIDKGKSEQPSQPPLPSPSEPKDTFVITPLPGTGGQTGTPGTVEEWVDKGKEHYIAGRYNEALAAYEQAIRLDPNNASAYVGKGDALKKLGYEHEAKDAYRLAQQLWD